MSGLGMTWARRQKAPSPTAKAILLLLGELSDDTGRTYRDQQYMADILQLSRETVLRNLAKLEEAGLITREARFAAKNTRMNDLIRLQIAEVFTVSEPRDAGSHGEENHVTLTQEPCDSNADNRVTQDHIKNKPLTKPKEQTTTAAALFERPTREIATIPDNPVDLVAKTLFDETKGAMPYMGTRQTMKWAMEKWPERSWQEIGQAMRSLYQAGRTPTRANLQRHLDGLAPNGRPVQMGTTEIRVRAGMAVAERYREEERQAQ